MIIVKELLSIYWAQFSFALTLVVGLFGYFIKRVYDLKTQKQVANHSLLQQHRIKAVNDFLSASSSMRIAFTSLPIYGLVNNEFHPYQLDEMVSTPLDNLKARALEARVFFPDEGAFEDIAKEYNSLNELLKKIFSTKRDTHAETTALCRTYISSCNEAMTRVNEKLKVLSAMVVKTYS